MTVSPSAETCRNMADLGWKCLCLDRSDMLPRGQGARWFQRAQPAAGIMEERVQSLKEGARGTGGVKILKMQAGLRQALSLQGTGRHSGN